MGHGDERGLRLPPRIAPIQVAIVVVRDEDGAVDKARELGDAIAATGVRVEVDADTHTGFGRRAVDWELKGVPVRIDLGPRDLAAGEVTLIRRDTRREAPGPARRPCPASSPSCSTTIQAAMLAEATAFRDAATTDVDARRGGARGRQARASAGSSGRSSAPRASAASSTTASASAASSAPTAPSPQSEDEPDLLAIVARAY